MREENWELPPETSLYFYPKGNSVIQPKPWIRVIKDAKGIVTFCTLSLFQFRNTLISSFSFIQSTGIIPHANWTLTVSAVRAILSWKNLVVKTKFCMFGSKCWFLVTWKRMHARVISETDAHKGSFWAPMHANRTAIVTDAHNGLLGNRYSQDMGQILDHATYILDARDPFNLVI